MQSAYNTLNNKASRSDVLCVQRNLEGIERTIHTPDLNRILISAINTNKPNHDKSRKSTIDFLLKKSKEIYEKHQNTSIGGRGCFKAINYCFNRKDGETILKILDYADFMFENNLRWVSIKKVWFEEGKFNDFLPELEFIFSGYGDKFIIFLLKYCNSDAVEYVKNHLLKQVISEYELGVYKDFVQILCSLDISDAILLEILKSSVQIGNAQRFVIRLILICQSRGISSAEILKSFPKKSGDLSSQQ